MAVAISAVARELAIPYIFKASYDKANRTSLASFRGPGLKAGLAILRKVAECAKVPVLTDVHEPARRSRRRRGGRRDPDSGFSLSSDRSAGGRGKVRARRQHQEGSVHFAAGHGARRRKSARRGRRARICHRAGASFGYNNLVVDMRSLAIMREFAPVVFDATHAVQLPSAGSASGATPTRKAQSSGTDSGSRGRGSVGRPAAVYPAATHVRQWLPESTGSSWKCTTTRARPSRTEPMRST